AALSLFELLPAGLLDSSGVRESVAEILKRRGVADQFDALARPLRVVAVDLDRGEAVAFGSRMRRDVPVSRAVQASAALPGLYRPVRIGGRDYVDGGVKKTAHVNLAIREGARLVFCINPMVPLRNDGDHRPLPGPLSGRGVAYVLDQALRIMLHGRTCGCSGTTSCATTPAEWWPSWATARRGRRFTGGAGPMRACSRGTASACAIRPASPRPPSPIAAAARRWPERSASRSSGWRRAWERGADGAAVAHAHPGPRGDPGRRGPRRAWRGIGPALPGVVA
ncbi:MAG: hypothetical protein DMF82_16095, partial [Acidobacteria bacterium]